MRDKLRPRPGPKSAIIFRSEFLNFIGNSQAHKKYGYYPSRYSIKSASISLTKSVCELLLNKLGMITVKDDVRAGHELPIIYEGVLSSVSL